MNRKFLFLVCPPLWEKIPHPAPAVLAPVVRKAGWEVILFDLNQAVYKRMPIETRKRWTVDSELIKKPFFERCRLEASQAFELLREMIELEKPGMTGFTVLNSNAEFCIETAAWIKKQFPLIQTVFGGPQSTVWHKDGFYPPEADYLVPGDGETILPEILNQTILSKQKIAPKFLKPLSVQSDFSIYSLKNYPGHGVLPVQCGRGCINGCLFCAERLLYPGCAYRNAEEVLSEITRFQSGYGLSHVLFTDSMLNSDLKFFKQMIEGLALKKTGLTWEAQIGIRNDMDEEMFSAMKKSGCVNLFIGLESGSAGILKKMNKPFKPEEASIFFQKLRKAGLQFEVSLIANYPGETEEEFKETLSFLKENAPFIPKIAQVSRFKAYPGIGVKIPADYDETLASGKIERMVQTLKENGIPFTPSYIDNLV